MRIVAGTLKGHAIEAPDGLGTRPTTDRVREALFSSLYSLLGGFEGIAVLDAFAGSGALGIEALSRGAQRAVFYEHDAKAAKTLRRNVQSCGLSPDKAQVVQRDVFKTAPSGGPFDLVFLDPPYAYEPTDVLSLVKMLCEGGSISENGVIVYEHALASKNSVAEAATANGFAIIASRKYGKTAITTLEMQ